MGKVSLMFPIAYVIAMAGCANLQPQPYTSAPSGVEINKSANGYYYVSSVTITKAQLSHDIKTIEFCFAQNIPNINGAPIVNPSKTKITAQGRDQVSFVVPLTMGQSLNYDLMFSLTAQPSDGNIKFGYTNIKIKGTWSNDENPLPGTKDASLYTDSAYEKLDKISSSVANCIKYE